MLRPFKTKELDLKEINNHLKMQIIQEIENS